MDQWHTQPSEFDKLPYYRIEYMEEDLKELLEAKNGKSQSGDSDEQEKYQKSIANQQSQMLKSMPKSISNFKMPQLKL